MKKQTKTTKEHFEYFVKCCEKYLEKFKLDGWSPRYEHMDSVNENAGALLKLESHLVTFYLSKEVDYGFFEEQCTIEEFLDRLAKHEVIHCLVGEVASSGKDRDYTTRDICQYEEVLVEKLIRLL